MRLSMYVIKWDVLRYLTPHSKFGGGVAQALRPSGRSFSS